MPRLLLALCAATLVATLLSALYPALIVVHALTH